MRVNLHRWPVLRHSSHAGSLYTQRIFFLWQASQACTAKLTSSATHHSSNVWIE